MLILPFEPSHFLQTFDQFTLKHALQNTQNDCHQWFLTAINCTKFIFGRPGETYNARALVGLRGPTSKRGGRKGEEKMGGVKREKEEKKKKRKGK